MSQAMRPRRGASPLVPEGYALVPLDGPGRWVQMHHLCGKTVIFVNPADNRVAWYVGSHRCGPIGTGWQERGTLPSFDPLLVATGGVLSARRAVQAVRGTVDHDVEPIDSELAGLLLGRLDSAAYHLAAAADHLAAEGAACAITPPLTTTEDPHNGTR